MDEGNSVSETAAALRAREFESQRARLMAVAYRLLSSHVDAEDAVQETWLRFARQDAVSIDNVPGWLTTVCGRVCIDLLRARSTRREVAHDEQDIPDLVVTTVPTPGPDDEAVLAESVGVALLLVLDTLNPAERLAFVLHDTFGVPFDEIGQIVGRSADASKMLASRARQKVRGAAPGAGERRAQRAVVDAFLAAAREGDFERLLAVLDPEVVWRTQTARGDIALRGAAEVAAKARQASYSKASDQAVLVNGWPGILARGRSGKALGVMMCRVVDGRIAEITSVIDGARLAAMDLPDADSSLAPRS
jgi:RNA polymerase sigma factor (sigma-70 family)